MVDEAFGPLDERYRSSAAGIHLSGLIISRALNDSRNLLHRSPPSELHAAQTLCERIIESLLRHQYVNGDGHGGWRNVVVRSRLDLQKLLTRSIEAKLDLAECYRSALRLLRNFESSAPGLMGRVPTECPYSLDQILGRAGEDWFPTPESVLVPVVCDFCGKSKYEVKMMVAGPSVFICDECVDLCHQITHGEIAPQTP
jgi:ClpX C4-type zinc finger/Domain of unknown function DUF29